MIRFLRESDAASSRLIDSTNMAQHQNIFFAFGFRFYLARHYSLLLPLPAK
jgi:hypothetical protein